MRIVLKASAISLLLAWSSLGLAATNYWTGASADWFSTNNWSLTNLPAAGDDVVITNVGANVLLTNATPYLSSLTLSNKTLTVSNGITRILATNIFIYNAATITVASVYTTNGAAYQMSNQVYISCWNLTLYTGGMINANSLGFAGGTSSGGYASGPGGGSNTAYYGSGGGGHGGRGGDSSQTVGDGGNTNDSADAPMLPGSGGGFGAVGTGAGGGLVTILASNSVTINGTVTANGANGSGGNGGGGAGGGIYINCATFGGSSTGLLSAVGGNSSTTAYGGGGGGGRIAVIYTTLAANPGVRFNVEYGMGNSLNINDWSTGRLGTNMSQKGTIYFSSLDLWNARIASASNTLQGITGYLVVPSIWTNWSTNSLTITNAWVLFLTNFEMSVTTLTIQNGGTLWLCPGTLDCSTLTIQNGGTASVWGVLNSSNVILPSGGALNLWPGTLNCATNIQVIGGTLTLGKPATLTCLGDLIVTNGGRLSMYSGPTNAVGGTNYGGWLTVGGTFGIASNGLVYPYSDTTNGGSVLISAYNLSIAAGGGINADSKGFGGGTNSSGYAPGPGGGSNAAGWGGGGGGHGGQGGLASKSGAVGGITNDSANAPIFPGSGGGYANQGGAGGGLVTIFASNSVTVNGTVTANGANGSGGNGGGGAGGGIYINCATFDGSSPGLLSAVGGNYTDFGGSGGGGRIAVWVDVSRGIRTRYLASNGANGRAVGRSTNWPQFTGTISIANGTGGTPVIPGGTPGVPGTVFFFKYVKGTIFSVPVP